MPRFMISLPLSTCSKMRIDEPFLVRSISQLEPAHVHCHVKMELRSVRTGVRMGIGNGMSLRSSWIGHSTKLD